MIGTAAKLPGVLLAVMLLAGCNGGARRGVQRGDGTGPFGLGALWRGVTALVSGGSSASSETAENAMLASAAGWLGPVAGLCLLGAVVVFVGSRFLPIVPVSMAWALALVSGACWLTIGLVQWWGPLFVFVAACALAAWAAVAGWQVFTRWRTKRRADALARAGRPHEAAALYESLDPTVRLTEECKATLNHRRMNGGGTVRLGKRTKVTMPLVAAGSA
jgi:hypothetical protein